MKIDLTETRLKAMAKTLRAELGTAAPRYQASLDILARVLGAKTFEQMKPQLADRADAGDLDPDALARALAPFARAFAAVDAAELNDSLDPEGRDGLTAEQSPEAERVKLRAFRHAHQALEGTVYLDGPTDADIAEDPEAFAEPTQVVLRHPHGGARLTVHLARVLNPAPPARVNLIMDARERIERSGLGGDALVVYTFRRGEQGQPTVQTRDRDEIPIDVPVSLRAEGRRTKAERKQIRKDLESAHIDLGLPRDQEMTVYATERGLFALAARDLPAMHHGETPVSLGLFLDGYDPEDPAGETSIPALLADIEEIF